MIITESMKRKWMAEGMRKGYRAAKAQQLNEVAPLIAAAARLGLQALKWFVVTILPDLIREYGPKMIESIKNSPNKEKASKSAFKKMLYAALDKVPAEKLSNLAADKLASSGKSINKELSKAEGYVAPSDQEVKKMVEEYKASKAAA